jgi:hypothetical protein
VAVPVIVQENVVNLGMPEHPSFDVDWQVGRHERVRRESEKDDGGIERNRFGGPQRVVAAVVVEQSRRRIREGGRDHGGAQGAYGKQAKTTKPGVGHDEDLRRNGCAGIADAYTSVGGEAPFPFWRDSVLPGSIRPQAAGIRRESAARRLGTRACQDEPTISS